MDNFIEEVDEELKRERYQDLWRKYGRYLVGAVLLVVIAVAAVVGWRQYQTNLRIESGLEYVRAVELAAADKPAEALAAFRALGEDGTAGYRAFARFREAALHAEQGNEAAAAEQYDAIARDADTDPIFRNLALLLYALSVADRAEPGALIERLEPLTAAQSPWRFSALEITALLKRRQGEVASAEAIYQRLADDPAAPQGVRARAAEFLAILGD